MLKKIASIIIIIVTNIALSGCESHFLPTRDEIANYNIIQAIGIDISTEDPSQMEVTFISRLEKAEGTSIIEIYSSTGPTIFEAQRKLKLHSDKKMFVGHVDYFLIGEDAAKENFTKYFDFVSRDQEIRLSPKVFIIKDCTAKEMINNTCVKDKFIVERLKGIEDDIGTMSNTNEVKILDIAAMLDNEDAATIIPALKCGETRNQKTTGEMPNIEIVISGYAVIKDFKLVGYIDETHSRGYNFLTNKVGSSAISVPDFSGEFVAFEVIKSKTKLEAHFKGNQLEGVTYKTHIISNIDEQHSRANIFTETAIQDLCTKQSEMMKAEMSQVISISQELKTDCTNLGQEIKMQHPLKWEHIKDNWNEIYPNLKIEIDVESEIARTYDIREPNGYKEESEG